MYPDISTSETFPLSLARGVACGLEVKPRLVRLLLPPTQQGRLLVPLNKVPNVFDGNVCMTNVTRLCGMLSQGFCVYCVTGCLFTVCKLYLKYFGAIVYLIAIRYYNNIRLFILIILIPWDKLGTYIWPSDPKLSRPCTMVTRIPTHAHCTNICHGWESNPRSLA